MFKLNKINEDNIQIYGSINGNAIKTKVNGMSCWRFSVKFFKGSVLNKVSSSEKDGTIWDTDILKERIKRAFESA